MNENERISIDKMWAELHKVVLRLQHSQETTRTRERELKKLRSENAALRAERDNTLALLEQERKLANDLGDENQQIAIRLHAAQATTRMREHATEHRIDMYRYVMAPHQFVNAVPEIADHSGDATEKATPSRLPAIGPEDC